MNLLDVSTDHLQAQSHCNAYVLPRTSDPVLGHKTNQALMCPGTLGLWDELNSPTHTLIKDRQYGIASAAPSALGLFRKRESARQGLVPDVPGSSFPIPAFLQRRQTFTACYYRLRPMPYSVPPPLSTLLCSGLVLNWQKVPSSRCRSSSIHALADYYFPAPRLSSTCSMAATVTALKTQRHDVGCPTDEQLLSLTADRPSHPIPPHPTPSRSLLFALS